MINTHCEHLPTKEKQIVDLFYQGCWPSMGMTYFVTDSSLVNPALKVDSTLVLSWPTVSNDGQTSDQHRVKVGHSGRLQMANANKCTIVVLSD